MKNNKKGFTLVELMTVIVILAILVSIAVPSAISVSNRIKLKMYNTKVDMVLKAAELYGQDNPDKVVSSEESCDSSNSVTIQNLIDDGKIKKDDMENGIVQNPINNSSMNAFKLCVYKKYKRVYAKPMNCEDWVKSGKLTNYCQG